MASIIYFQLTDSTNTWEMLYSSDAHSGLLKLKEFVLHIGFHHEASQLELET